MSNIEKRARELLPCPFCGNSAEFVPYKRDGLTLKCMSLGCIQRNQRSLRYGIDSLRDSMARHWNSRAALTTPEGYVLVPVEPTDEMLSTGYGWMMGPSVMRKLWTQLLAARPGVME